MRLYLVCVVFILGAIPVGAYVLHYNIVNLAKHSFNWKDVHNPATWNSVIMVRSGGVVFYDRWIWLGNATAAFIFFGIGKEALDMYRTGLLTIGLGRIIPSLKSDRHDSTTTTVNSFSSRAKMLFKRTSSSSSWTSDSHTTSKSDEAYPKNMALSTIDENPSTNERPLGDNYKDRSTSYRTTRKLSALSKLASMLPLRGETHNANPPLPVPALSMQQGTVESAVISTPRTPSLAQHVRSISPDGLIIRKEVRQGSEHEMTEIQ
jgi:pheromone a factor receptor